MSADGAVGEQELGESWRAARGRAASTILRQALLAWPRLSRNPRGVLAHSPSAGITSSQSGPIF